MSYRWKLLQSVRYTLLFVVYLDHGIAHWVARSNFLPNKGFDLRLFKRGATATVECVSSSLLGWYGTWQGSMSPFCDGSRCYQMIVPA